MTSRVSLSLLVAALAFLVLPSYGTAQAPRRPTSPLQAATRALLEGRFDEADAMADKLDVRDPSVAAIKARSAIARGRYAEAEALLRPVVARAPASEAALELGLLQHMLGRPDATAILERVARAGRHDARSAGARARARARCARSAASRKPTPRIATPRPTRPASRRFKPAGAICSSRSTTTPKR